VLLALAALKLHELMPQKMGRRRCQREGVAGAGRNIKSDSGSTSQTTTFCLIKWVSWVGVAAYGVSFCIFMYSDNENWRHQPNQTQRRHHHRRRHSHRHRRGVLQLNSTRQTTEADIKYTPRCAAGGIGHAACRDLALTIYSLVTRLNFTWQAEGNTGASF